MAKQGLSCGDKHDNTTHQNGDTKKKKCYQCTKHKRYHFTKVWQPDTLRTVDFSFTVDLRGKSIHFRRQRSTPTGYTTTLPTNVYIFWPLVLNHSTGRMTMVPDVSFSLPISPVSTLPGKEISSETHERTEQNVKENF